ncbi:LOW QUALITY PROTEIN: serine/threonine-protein kinase-like protein At1g28390 [Argentina anserina]|uniref:LOW QUALITY PROTEIN: serine/threonine-protein kinase-like protein At1g28390 n=1 Tax=Argentina anserina TaxID=57926 RepID=UPI002176548F|nr:LOW QUALITY PROTEIN: serine/threonine-protein kinase-like protein At1g28390 [Potentilla anserina]
MGYFSCNAGSAAAICDSYNNLRKPKPNKPISIREFPYDVLAAATNGFSAESFLGKGSHGSVYKAILDKGSLIAAVKKTKYPKQTTSLGRRNCTTCVAAENEIEILSRVRHPRLVNLIGFCPDDSKNDGKLIVVEYMPNGTLYDMLHSRTRPPGWVRRVRLSLHVAKAVQVLHCSNPPVIHRDIKSSNVLIDGNWNARLGDLGLALRGHVEDVRVRCTPPAGTLGYLDPGYLAPGDLSAKSDVFSFGILLLEIVSGRNAIDVNYSPPSVIDWALPLIKHGDYAALCDRRMGPPPDPAVIRQLAVLAARCVRSTAEKRPSMAEVVECLKAVKERVHAPIWYSLKRRVWGVEREEKDDEVEEVVRSTRGSRRKLNGKVSSVLGVEYEGEDEAMIGGRVLRSRSIGSVNEIKAGSGGGVRMGAGVAVKVRLSKSRSVGGVLGSPRIVRRNKRGLLIESIRLDMSKLVISVDGERSDRNLGETSGFYLTLGIMGIFSSIGIDRIVVYQI